MGRWRRGVVIMDRRRMLSGGGSGLGPKHFRGVLAVLDRLERRLLLSMLLCGGCAAQ